MKYIFNTPAPDMPGRFNLIEENVSDMARNAIIDEYRDALLAGCAEGINESYIKPIAEQLKKK